MVARAIFCFTLLTSVLSASFAQAAVQMPSHCKLNVAQTMLPDFSCSGTVSDCYAKAVRALKDQAAVLNHQLTGCPQSDDETYLSEYDFTGGYSEYSFVFLPGLFDTASQFWTFKNTFGANNGMRVVLPGHGASSWQGGAVTPEDWTNAAHRAIKLAGYLGKKVILVGQSTGAFLEVWAAAQTDLKVSGVAVFEPALKVRDYYGSALCYIPAFDLSVFPHGRFFEENINLGCVIRMLSETQLPKLMQPATLQRLTKIPFYFFINPYDIVVNSSTTLKFAKALQAAGGDVTFEAYNRKYEGIHMHADVVRLALRPRFAERLSGQTAFDQILRGRNSYAEFLATRFNLCDSATSASYLQGFSTGYDALYLDRVSLSRLQSALSELSTTTTGQLSTATRQTLQAYQLLYVNSLKERDDWSFPTDGTHFIMHEQDWSELHSLCCNVFEDTKRFFTATFVGPTYATLQQERAQISADLSKGVAGQLDAATAHRLVDYLSGKENQFLLSPLIADDFSSANSWATGKGVCTAWTAIPAMDMTAQDIEAEIHDFTAHHSNMKPSGDDVK